VGPSAMRLFDGSRYVGVCSCHVSDLASKRLCFVQRIFLFMGGEDGLIDHNEWMSTHQALGMIVAGAVPTCKGGGWVTCVCMLGCAAGVDDAHLAEAMFMIAVRVGGRIFPHASGVQYCSIHSLVR